MKPKERKRIFAWEERKRNERVRYCCLQEDSKRGENKMLPHLKEIISVYMRVKKNKKNKRDFSLTVRHTQELL